MSEIMSGIIVFIITYAVTGSIGFSLFGSKLLFAYVLSSVLATSLFLYCFWHLVNNVKEAVLAIIRLNNTLSEIETYLIHRDVRKDLDKNK